MKFAPPFRDNGRGTFHLGLSRLSVFPYLFGHAEVCQGEKAPAQIEVVFRDVYIAIAESVCFYSSTAFQV